MNSNNNVSAGGRFLSRLNSRMPLPFFVLYSSLLFLLFSILWYDQVAQFNRVTANLKEAREELSTLEKTMVDIIQDEVAKKEETLRERVAQTMKRKEAIIERSYTLIKEAEQELKTAESEAQAKSLAAQSTAEQLATERAEVDAAKLELQKEKKQFDADRQLSESRAADLRTQLRRAQDRLAAVGAGGATALGDGGENDDSLLQAGLDGNVTSLPETDSANVHRVLIRDLIAAVVVGQDFDVDDDSLVEQQDADLVGLPGSDTAAATAAALWSTDSEGSFGETAAKKSVKKQKRQQLITEERVKTIISSWGRRMGAGNVLFFTRKPLNESALKSDGSVEFEQVLIPDSVPKNSLDLSYFVWTHLSDHYLTGPAAKKWFLKSDDKTFWLENNLLDQLKVYDSGLPFLFGHIEYHIQLQTYYALSDSGYILSHAALTRLSKSLPQCLVESRQLSVRHEVGTRGRGDKKRPKYEFLTIPEDVSIAKCIYDRLSVKPKVLGEQFPDGLAKLQTRSTNIEDQPISIHTSDYQEMAALNFLLYQIKT